MSGDRAAIYVRVSQDREGAGLAVHRQEEDCRALAESLGWRVLDVYVDNDVSAYSGKPRPAYERLMADLRAGAVDAVLCWHTDRLHRSPKELEAFIDVAENVPTQTVKAGLLDLSTPAGRMVARNLGSIARYESEHKSERQKRKVLELARAGKPLGGGRPFGYEADGMTVRESEAGELRAMVSKVLAGESLGSIMRDLNDRGVTTTRGGRWVYSSLRSLLLRPRNVGLMQHQGKVIGKAQWPAIVSEEDHHALAVLLADPRRRTTSGPKRKHLLSGLAECGVCGKKMKAGAVTSRGQRYALYRCCVHRSIPKVDRHVEDIVLTLLEDVRLVRAIMRRTDSDQGALEAERDALNARLDEARTAYANGLVGIDTLTAVEAQVVPRVQQIDSELTPSDPVLRDLLVEQAEVRSRWEALSLEAKRQVIDSLVQVRVLPVGHKGRGPQPVAKSIEVTMRSTGSTRVGGTMPRAVQEKIAATFV